MRKHTILMTLTATVLTSGCSTLYKPTPRVTTVDEDFVVSSTASLSHTMVQDRNSGDPL